MSYYDAYDLALIILCVISVVYALVNFYYERKAVHSLEECQKELEDSKTYQKSLEKSKQTLEMSLLTLKNTEMTTKRLQISNNYYKLVTKIDIPLEVFVYPSDSHPCINEGLKEKIALSIAKEMVSDELMTVTWEDDGLNMTRHAEASVKVMCDKGEHWF